MYVSSKQSYVWYHKAVSRAVFKGHYTIGSSSIIQQGRTFGPLLHCSLTWSNCWLHSYIQRVQIFIRIASVQMNLLYIYSFGPCWVRMIGSHYYFFCLSLRPLSLIYPCPWLHMSMFPNLILCFVLSHELGKRKSGLTSVTFTPQRSRLQHSNTTVHKMPQPCGIKVVACLRLHIRFGQILLLCYRPTISK